MEVDLKRAFYYVRTRILELNDCIREESKEAEMSLQFHLMASVIMASRRVDYRITAMQGMSFKCFSSNVILN